MAEVTNPEALRFAQQLASLSQAWAHAVEMLEAATRAESLIAEADGRRRAIEEEIDRLNQRLAQIRADVQTAAEQAARDRQTIAAQVAAERATAEAAIAAARDAVQAAQARATQDVTQARDAATAEMRQIAGEVETRRAAVRALDEEIAGKRRLLDETLPAEEAKARARLEEARRDYEAFVESLRRGR